MIEALEPPRGRFSPVYSPARTLHRSRSAVLFVSNERARKRRLLPGGRTRRPAKPLGTSSSARSSEMTAGMSTANASITASRSPRMSWQQTKEAGSKNPVYSVSLTSIIRDLAGYSCLVLPTSLNCRGNHRQNPTRPRNPPTPDQLDDRALTRGKNLSHEPCRDTRTRSLP